MSTDDASTDLGLKRAFEAAMTFAGNYETPCRLLRLRVSIVPAFIAHDLGWVDNCGYVNNVNIIYEYAQLCAFLPKFSLHLHSDLAHLYNVHSNSPGRTRDE